jgi:hypothetical protein
LAVVGGLAVITKFSGIIIILLAFVSLAAWASRNRSSKNAIMAAGCGVAVAGVSWLAIWAAYDFRFSPTPDNKHYFNIQGLLEFEATMELRAKANALADHDSPKPPDLASWRPSLGTRALLWAHQNALLPEAYIAGIMYTRASAHWRPGYLLGEVRDTGWWHYFPVAVAVKTPVGTLLLVGAAAFAVWRCREKLPIGIWVSLVGIAWYGGFALASNLNIGLRHLLPVYLPAAIIVGWAASQLARSRPWRVSLLLMLTATLAEVAIPQDRIAFFNAIGRAIGPVRLLGDSNLDWGQHVGALARWQKAHGDPKLYLCYFGGADPRAYGLEYENIAGSWAPGPTARHIEDDALVAVSATHLQGIYLLPGLARRHHQLHESAEPVTVIGGTIWVYRATDYMRYVQ